MVSEEEYDNDETMVEGGEGEIKAYGRMGRRSHVMDSGIMEKGRKKCINQEHAEDSFEASYCNIIKFRSEICNTIEQSKTQAKPIDLSQTSHPQLQALKLRHELDEQSQPGVKRIKSTSQTCWWKLYSQQQNGTAFQDIGGKTGQQHHWLMTNGGYSKS